MCLCCDFCSCETYISQTAKCRKMNRPWEKARVGQHLKSLGDEAELWEPEGRWQWQEQPTDELWRLLGADRCTNCCVGWKVLKYPLLARIRPAFSEPLEPSKINSSQLQGDLKERNVSFVFFPFRLDRGAVCTHQRSCTSSVSISLDMSSKTSVSRPFK